jgi:trk system potassium uptake protein TrkH
MATLLRTLLRDIGILLHVPGFLVLPCVGVAAIAGEYGLLAPLFVTIGLSFGLGQVGFRLRVKDNPGVPGAVRLGALGLAWLLAAAIATVPFAWAGQNAITPEAARAYGTVLSAFFEAVSGLTGTGLTMSGDPSGLSYTLQFWRSALEWAGGIGMVLLAAFILRPTVSLRPIHKSELNIGAPEDAEMRRLAGYLLLIYTGLTVVSSIIVCSRSATWALSEARRRVFSLPWRLPGLSQRRCSAVHSRASSHLWTPHSTR